MHTIYLDRAELESEVQVKHVQKKHGGPQAISYVGTNISFNQGKPRCIIAQSFTFILNSYLYVTIDCALDL
jgi:hypothetical protein